MKRCAVLLLTILLLWNITACGQQSDDPAVKYEYGLWFAVGRDSVRNDSSALVCETRAWETMPSPLQLMQALLHGPESSDLYVPIPAGVRLVSVEFREASKTVLVDLSEEYGKLSGFELTLADYCITLTLCQLPEIENVRITAEGKTLTARNRQRLHSGDVLLSGISNEPDTFLAALYFPNKRGSLSVEYRQVSRVGSSEPVEIVLYELLRGPSATDIFEALPSGTRVRDLEVSGGVCQVDLSRDFMTNAPQDPERAGLTLYALVNSLCALAGVNQVRVMVEGEALTSFGGVTAGSQNLFASNLDLLDSQIKD